MRQKADKAKMRKADLKANADYVKKWIAVNSEGIEKGFVTERFVKEEAEFIIANAKQYTWLIDQTLMDRVMLTIRQILVNDLLSGSDFWTRRFWFNAYLDKAYETGTTQALFSGLRVTEGVTLTAQAQSSMSVLSAESVLASAPYQRRLGLVHGRVFEEMKGLTETMTKDLRRTLTEGMARGLGIRDIKQMVNSRVGVGMARSEVIARTEINKAYTDSYMGETQDLNDILDDDPTSIKQMHFSALAPTTRLSHAERHGKIYTDAQQKAWWDTGSNRINCLCSTIAVLVDDKTGEVVQEDMVDRLKKEGQQFFAERGITKQPA